MWYYPQNVQNGSHIHNVDNGQSEGINISLIFKSKQLLERRLLAPHSVFLSEIHQSATVVQFPGSSSLISE
jgi:hypothetical protein